MVAGPGVVDGGFHEADVGAGGPAAGGHIGPAFGDVAANDQEGFVTRNGFGNFHVAVQDLGQLVPGGFLMGPGELHEALLFPFCRQSHNDEY